MSGQAMGWVLRSGPRKRAQRAVLLTIADAANRDGEFAHPGMNAIVDGSLYSEGHVRRIIGELIEEGWIEQTALPGPGMVVEYRLPLMSEENVAHYARRSPENQGGSPKATPRERRANAARLGARCSEESTNSLIINNNINEVSPDVIELCDYLADRIAEFRESPERRPRITTSWHRDMDKLIRLGPKDRAKSNVVSPDEIRAFIDNLFDNLADPEGSGFCWAAQIQAPSGLRAKWDKIEVAGRSKIRSLARKPTNPLRRGGEKLSDIIARAAEGEAREMREAQ